MNTDGTPTSSGRDLPADLLTIALLADFPAVAPATMRGAVTRAAAAVQIFAVGAGERPALIGQIARNELRLYERST